MERTDVIKSQYSKLKISNIDIGMLILVYSSDEYQVFADYAEYKQSQYFHQEGKNEEKNNYRDFNCNLYNNYRSDSNEI